MTPSHLPFETIEYKQYGAEMSATEVWIDNQQEFENIYRKLNQHLSPTLETPAVDFDEYAVIFLHFGKFNYGGIEYEVVSIEENNKILNIKLNRNAPKFGEPALTVITNPFMFIEVPNIKPAPEQINLILIEKN